MEGRPRLRARQLLRSRDRVGTTDPSSACNGVPNWDWYYPDRINDQVLCLQMNFPLPATVPQHTCVRESGPASDPTFSLVTSCSYANAVIEGSVFTPNDRSFCGRYRWYTWQSDAYPQLGVTVCWAPY